MKYSDEELIGYLEGDFDPVRRSDIEADISISPELKKKVEELKKTLQWIAEAHEYNPPSYLKANFMRDIHQEKSHVSQTSFSWFQVAAAFLLLVIGFGAGSIFHRQKDTNIAELKDQVQVLQQLVLMGSLKDYTTSERLLAVSMIEQGDNRSNDELVKTLISTINNDPSPNVRYAGIQAMRRFMSDEYVRLAMVRSLEKQTDPLLQIAIINVLVEADEKSAIKSFKEIIKDEKKNPEVREQALIALEVLI